MKAIAAGEDFSGLFRGVMLQQFHAPVENVPFAALCLGGALILAGGIQRIPGLLLLLRQGMVLLGLVPCAGRCGLRAQRSSLIREPFGGPKNRIGTMAATLRRVGNAGDDERWLVEKLRCCSGADRQIKLPDLVVAQNKGAR